MLSEVYFKEENFSLYQGDCIEIMKNMKTSSIDMIFADPPYFLSNNGITCQSGKMVSVNKGNWDQSNGLSKDLEFHQSWIEECRRVLKIDGTIWISGTLHNIFAIGFILQTLKFRILNDIIWYKPNAPPNLSCRYFTHSHETLIWAKKKKKSKHKFNYEVMKYWNSSKDNFHNENKQMRDIWRISKTPELEKLNGKHPTQKPLELLKRVILASTDENDLILDPFNGSGTTAISAFINRRKYIGIDIEKKYLDLTIKRKRKVKQKISISDRISLLNFIKKEH